MTIIITLVALVIIAILYYMMTKENNRLRKELAIQEKSTEEFALLYQSLRERLEKDAQNEVLFHFEYCTSDSDINKYTDKEHMEKVIKSKIAKTLMNDIFKKFGDPDKLPLGDGNEKYSYSIKVKRI